MFRLIVGLWCLLTPKKEPIKLTNKRPVDEVQEDAIELPPPISFPATNKRPRPEVKEGAIKLTNKRPVDEVQEDAIKLSPAMERTLAWLAAFEVTPRVPRDLTAEELEDAQKDENMYIATMCDMIQEAENIETVNEAIRAAEKDLL